jgi:hypothetical protein
LLGEPHLAHPAFAKFADELKPPAKKLSRHQAHGARRRGVRTELVRQRRLQEFVAHAIADQQQRLELRAQRRIRRAHLIEEPGARLRAQEDGLVQQFFDAPPTRRVHGDAALLISWRPDPRCGPVCGSM